MECIHKTSYKLLRVWVPNYFSGFIFLSDMLTGREPLWSFWKHVFEICSVHRHLTIYIDGEQCQGKFKTKGLKISAASNTNTLSPQPVLTARFMHCIICMGVITCWKGSSIDVCGSPSTLIIRYLWHPPLRLKGFFTHLTKNLQC